jgi:hypothetical protein
MPDAADYELQKEPQVVGPPASRPPSFTPLIVGVLVLAAAVAAFLYLRRDAKAPVSTEGSLATESAVPPSAPLGVEVEPIALPPLDATDELVRSLVRALSSHPRIAAWLTTDGLIRNFTVVVENIAAGRTPSGHLRVLKPAGPFTVVDARGGDVVIDPRSYNRYNDIAAAVASLDPGGAAKLYSTLKPQIEDAYRELGEQGSFDRVLETAIVRLLEAPAVAGEVALVPRGAVYNFNDPRLERLTQAQKQLVRMGARNVQVIQRKLRDIALALGIAPERLPGR